jgi:hypothetical protein
MSSVTGLHVQKNKKERTKATVVFATFAQIYVFFSQMPHDFFLPESRSLAPIALLLLDPTVLQTKIKNK